MSSFFDTDEDIDDYADEINRCANIADWDQAGWDDNWEDKLGKHRTRRYKHRQNMKEAVGTKNTPPRRQNVKKKKKRHQLFCTVM